MSDKYNASLLAKHIENAINDVRKLGIKVVICGNKILVENTAHEFALESMNINPNDPFYKGYIELEVEDEEKNGKMLWKDLSKEAKSILEWVENPLTNKRMTITVERNKVWFMKCPVWSGDVRINVTNSIFSEIKDYINSDENIKVIENGEDKLVFTLIDGIKLH